MSPREITVTELKVQVFTEVPFRDELLSLRQFLDWQHNNLCHAVVSRTGERRLNAAEAAAELATHNLSPGIFGIADDGSELDDSEPDE